MVKIFFSFIENKIINIIILLSSILRIQFRWIKKKKNQFWMPHCPLGTPKISPSNATPNCHYVRLWLFIRFVHVHKKIIDFHFKTYLTHDVIKSNITTVIKKKRNCKMRLESKHSSKNKTLITMWKINDSISSL